MREKTSPQVSKLLLLPSLALSAGGFFFGMSFATDELVATPLSSSDLDDDGLVDAQEAILKTDPFRSDTDGDGVSDLEELARGSDPLVFASVPALDPGSLAMTGRVVDGVYRAVTTLYIEGGDLTGANLTFGVMVDSMMVNLDPNLFFIGADIIVKPGQAPGDLIYLLDTPIPEALLSSLGDLALFVTYTPMGGSQVSTAASINLAHVSGVVSEVVLSQTGGGSYRPLVDDPDMPATWSPAQVCVQDLTTVGQIGAVLQQEVTASGCQSIAADSYCPPNCSNLTGTTQQIVDPIGLIGG